MKTLKSIVALLVLMTMAAGTAWADHRHFRSNVYLGIGVGPHWGHSYGPGYWGPSWYYPPAYYYPPEPVVIQSPPVYVEQAAPAPAPSASAESYWYYCPASKRYYPYVSECPSGWQQVSPTPPPPTSRGSR